MHPRIVVTGATTAFTRRTTMRKGFLAPWHPLVKDIWLYSLADAQEHTDVAVHSTTLVVSHHHTTVTPERDNLPRFLMRVHRDTSCAINTLLAHELYDAPGEVFDDRQTHAMRLLDCTRQITQLVYEHNNCVAAGLVSRPEHMPDHVFDFELWKHDGIVVKRPDVYFDKSRPRELQLRLSPPPLLVRMFDGDIDRLVFHMKRLSEHAGQQLRAARNRRPPLGAQAVRRVHPWSEPQTLRERRRQRVPAFCIGTRGIEGALAAVAAAEETREFREEHRMQRVARKGGDFGAKFPFGTYAMRVDHNAPVQPEPKGTAFVTKPGPLLADVMQELAVERTPHDRNADHALTIQLVEQARADISEQANAVVEDDAMIFDPPEQAEAENATASDERPPAVVRHRFTRTKSNTDNAPRRIITLRDARRGRPPGKHGNDPPV